MATNEWKCMQCEWVGKPEEISKDSDDDHFCPKCGDYDVFPQRYFLCLACVYQAEQLDFFPELPADEDPEETLEVGVRDMPVYHTRPSNGEECESYTWIQIR